LWRETALIESLEGKREILVSNHHFLQFRDCGLTTVVNNVETIASVPWIVNNSGDDYANIGIGRSTGTKLISASGNIKIRCLRN
jgi:NADH-quinone oxidoreductase subunit F